MGKKTTKKYLKIAAFIRQKVNIRIMSHEMSSNHREVTRLSGDCMVFTISSYTNRPAFFPQTKST